jgi:hypothetical protein
MIAPVMSLSQLRTKAKSDKKYADLAILAATNLGYEVEDSLEGALSSLTDEALETSEDDVIEEINFLRSEV